MKKLYAVIISFILFVPPLVFFTDLTRNPYYFQIVLLNAATVLLWMVWLYRGLREGKLLVRRTPLDAPLLAFFAAATASWLFVLFQNLPEPYLRASVSSEGLKRWLFLLTNAVLVYYAAVHFADEDNRPRFIGITIAAGLIASLYGILQYFGIEFIWPKVLNPFGGRSVSTFGNPNFLSSYLVLLFPVVFIYYLQAQSPGKRFFHLFSLLSFFAALLCTLTRSSWLGLIAALAVTVAAVWKFEPALLKARKNLFLVPAALLLTMTVFWPRSNVAGYSPSVIERLSETKQISDTNYSPFHQRRLIWSCAWHMAAERPVLGRGWGCFELYYPFYQGRHLFLPMYQTMRTHANNAHNEVLEIWSQTGIVGLGLYLWGLAVIVAYTLFLLKNLQGGRRLLAVALFSSLAGMWVDNLLNVSLHFAVPGFLAWWHLGLLSGLGKPEERPLTLRSPGARLLAAGGIIFGALLVVRYANNFRAEMHYFKGFKLSKKDAVQQAIPELEKAHRLQRFEVNSNYELANCYARAGQRDKAVEGYAEALRANAGYDEIYFNLATVLLQKGEHQRAISEYTKSLYINPVSQESYNALGTVFLQDPDRYKEAGIALFRQALHFFPANRDLWNNLGFLYTRTDRNEEALEAYKQALTLDPDFELARRNLQFTLSRLGRRDRDFEETEGLLRRVEEYIVAGNYPAALPLCERLAGKMPRSFKVRLYLANLYFSERRPERAVPEYQEALRLSPNNGAALCNLGLAYFQLQQFDRARETFRQALAADPGNELVKQKLEELSRLTGRR